ncbi:hypothetical protein [Ureibacillus sp. FSL K6-2830]|uniref:hypothetical protein n=1 Tax=Ureibacillus sp. FSL K6-2830 TaxID=2954610 RepID=UPI0030FA7655
MRKLLLQLLHAKSEEEVKDIIDNSPILSNPSNWLPYGGTTGNYSSFENQQSTSMGALVEKFTNSIDAILTRKCLEKGIDPSSDKAPKSMEEAVKTLFTPDELKNTRVHVFTDGSKDSVNVITVDDGEGQHPDNFENTLLSLQRGNKNSIHFVQGKFNMGSTGAVVFCGKHKYQLIVSRRHTGIDPNSKEVGFTLVRKHERNEEELNKYKNTWYEYFVIDGKIARFTLEDDETIEVINGIKESSFKQGTIIKMYNYDLPSKSQSFQGLKEEINRLLYFPAFPINVYETRKDYEVVKNRKKGYVMNTAYGAGTILKKKVEEDGENSKEKRKITPIYESINNELRDTIFGKALIDIYLFENKKDIEDVRGKTPVVFLMNGQVQYSLNTTYISKDLGFKLIKDTLLVTIDCTNLSRSFLDEGFFMANRETIRKTEHSKYFIDKVTSFLKENPELDKLNRERATKQVSGSSTKKLFESLLGKNAQNSMLKNFFKDDVLGAANNGTSSSSKKEKPEIQLKEFPTYMKVNNMDVEDGNETVKTVPINGRLSLKVITDACDNYFTRDEARGEFSIRIKNREKDEKENDGNQIGDNKDFGEAFTIKRSSLKNGQMNIQLEAKESVVNVGEEVAIELNMKDEQNEFTHIVLVKFIDPVKKEKKSTKKGNKKLELPALIQVFKDQESIDALDKSDEEKEQYKTWEDMSWDEEEGKSKIVYLEPGLEDQPVGAIYINMNSSVLEQIMTEEGTTGTKKALVQNQFITQLYMNSFLIAAALMKIEKSDSDKEFELERIEAEKLITRIIEETAYLAVKMQVNNINNAMQFV